MYAVGDRLHGIAREHAQRDLAVAHRDAVDVARETQPQIRHVQRVVQQAAALLQRRDAAAAQHLADQLAAELVVAGRHRRMRGEHAAPAHRLDIGLFRSLLPLTP